jgi:hypothetical protein
MYRRKTPSRLNLGTPEVKDQTVFPIMPTEMVFHLKGLASIKCVCVGFQAARQIIGWDSLHPAISDSASRDRPVKSNHPLLKYVQRLSTSDIQIITGATSAMRRKRSLAFHPSHSLPRGEQCPSRNPTTTPTVRPFLIRGEAEKTTGRKLPSLRIKNILVTSRSSIPFSRTCRPGHSLCRIRETRRDACSVVSSCIFLPRSSAVGPPQHHFGDWVNVGDHSLQVESVNARQPRCSWPTGSALRFPAQRRLHLFHVGISVRRNRQRARARFFSRSFERTVS